MSRLKSRNDSFRREPLALAARLELSHESTVVTLALEVYSLRPGPDGSTRITVHRLGEGMRRSWLVPAEQAEDAVLDGWAEEHDRRLGYPPNW